MNDMLLYKNSFYQFILDQSNSVLEFHWLSTDRTFDYEHFQEACSNYAGYACEKNANKLLVFTKNFKVQLPPEFPEWQKEEHYPRLYKIGVRKMAYVIPEEYLSQASDYEADPDNVVSKHFATKESAISWLLN